MRASVNPARWLKSERLFAVQPDPKNAGSADWRKRLRAFPGRSLSHLALTAEQEERSGRLALRGQALSPGVIGGLDVDFDNDPEPLLRIAPGFALAPTGEDISLARELVLTPTSLLVAGTRNPEAAGSVDVSLGELLPRPRVLVLVLRPAEILSRADADPSDPCEDDPAADAFLDHQRVDAVLPLWVRLTPSMASLLRDSDPTSRNRLAFAIFQREIDAARQNAAVREGTEAALPWEEEGVPVALVGFDAAGKIAFVDRHAVRRLGGKARSRSPLLLQAGPRGLYQGSPALWQARLLQLADHVVDLLDQNREQPGAVYKSFSYAPPAGILPKDLFDDLSLPSRSQRLFPAHAQIEWMPIPTEQLDATLAASASLSRIDFSRAFVVRVLLPVPEAVYEPRLLCVETPSEELQAKLAQIRLGLAKARYLRDRLSEQVSNVSAQLDGTRPAGPSEIGQGGVETALASKDYPPIPAPFDFDAASSTFFAALSATDLGGSKTTQAIRDVLAKSGMQGVYDELLRIIQATDDAVEAGFLRAQADIYRARQVMLGNDKVTELAISPALASIVRGGTAEASAADVERAITKLGKTAEKPAPGIGVSAPTATGVTEITSQPAMLFRSVAIGGRPTDGLPTISREGAQTSKYTAVSAVTTTIASLGADKLGGLFHGIQVTVPSAKAGADDKYTAETMDLTFLASAAEPLAVLKKRRDLETRLDRDTGNMLADESGYITSGIRMVEETLSTLRQIEQRVLRLRRLLALAERLIAVVKSAKEEAQARLASAQKALEEARHDHAVALALVAEDAAEVVETNERRRRIVEQHVKFVAFVRPRTENLFNDAPGRDLEAPEEQPIPTCLREQVGVIPDELRRAIDLVRRAPLSFFPPLQPLLGDLGNRPHLIELVRATALSPLVGAVPAPASTQAVSLSLSRGLSDSLVTMEDQLTERRDNLKAVRAEELESRSFQELRTQALTVVSLADFVHVSALRPDIHQRATLATEAFTRVAACLYRRFGDVSPAIRLGWAQTVSVFDKPVGLRNLMVLPRFQDLPREDRGTLQALVDYLYSFAAPLPRAQALLDTLVRVCVLCASHAPARALLRGTVPKTTLSVGHIFQIKAIDVAKARAGMTVLVSSAGEIKARAVVEDIATDTVTARILMTPTTTVPLPDDAEALLGDPDDIRIAARKLVGKFAM